MRVTLVLMPMWNTGMPSLGIAYLASNIATHGHSVSRLEFNLEPIDDKTAECFGNINSRQFIKEVSQDPSLLDRDQYAFLKERIEQYVTRILDSAPDVVGFSVYRGNHAVSLLAARRIRERAQSVVIVFGGPETLIDTGFLATPWVDYAIIGEGERVFAELLENLTSTAKVSGISYMKDGAIVKSAPRPIDRIDDLEIPLFRQEDIDTAANGWMLPLLTSRGCVGNCRFCDEKVYWRRFRQRSAEKVVDEMKQRIAQFGIRHFVFNDSLLNADTDFLNELCTRIIHENLPVRWRANVRPDPQFSKEDFKHMYQAGCRCLQFGVESGSDSVLDAMNKRVTSALIERNLRAAHDSGIWTHAYFIIGYPTESHGQFLETVQFIVRNRDSIDSFHPHPCRISEEMRILYGIQSNDQRVAAERLHALDRIFTYRKRFPLRYMKKDLVRNMVGSIRFRRSITVDRDALSAYSQSLPPEYPFTRENPCPAQKLFK